LGKGSHPRPFSPLWAGNPINPIITPASGAGRAAGHIGGLGDRGHGLAPHGCAVVLADASELLHSGGASIERRLAVALEHDARGSPNVDFRYRAGKLRRRGDMASLVAMVL
jgi:hypothetical protein